MRQIIATVDPEGNIAIRAVGFKGKSCLEATRQIERMLGKVQKRERTREFWMAPAGKESVGEGG